MLIENERMSHVDQSWRDDLCHLLAEPIRVTRKSSRERRTIGVSVTPLQREDETLVDLVFVLFFLHPFLAEEEEQAADNVMYQVFVDGLRSLDYHLRQAACEGLGKLGLPAAAEVLHTALEDNNRHVRAAATAALETLALPRGRVMELADVRLVLWQQVKHLWKPIGIATTNQYGRARFSDVPADATCRFSLAARTLGSERASPSKMKTSLRAQQTSPWEIAAASGRIDTTSLPHSTRITVEGNSLLCTLYRDDEEQVVMEFRSDAPVQDSWVFFTATPRDTDNKTIEQSILLTLDTRGILTGHCVLNDLLDLTREYEIEFETVSTPQWTT